MKSAHIEEFDGLRAIAVFAVLVSHFMGKAVGYFPAGGLGVQLFFVLSGFLITRILIGSINRIRKNNSTIKEELITFYIRRTLRIFPVYYLLIFTTAVAGIDVIRDYFWWYALYMTNFLVFELGHFPRLAGVFWSLAVEEQFYLLWPAAVLLVPRRFLMPLIVALLACALVFRGALSSLPRITYNTLLPANLDALIGGALLAVLHLKGTNRNQIALILSGLAAVGSLLIAYDYLGADPLPIITSQVKLGMAAISLLTVHVAAAWSGAAFLAGLRIAPLRYLGKISYGIYLYHLFVGYGLEKMGLALDSVSEFFVKAAATVLVASVSWFAFESPINNLKRRYPYRRHPEPVGATS